MNFVLTRDPFHGEYRPTMGVISWEDEELQTLERPWNDNKGDIAGVPADQASCVYPGVYDLYWDIRPGNVKAVALVCHSIDVYFAKSDIPQELIDQGIGRYQVLVHSANRMHEVIGCIALGLYRTKMANEDAVGSSRLAVERFMDALFKYATTEFEPGVFTGCTLEIRQANAPYKFE